MIAYSCGYGGTGRRVRLRGVWDFPCEFDSHWPHHLNQTQVIQRDYLFFYSLNSTVIHQLYSLLTRGLTQNIMISQIKMISSSQSF